VIGHVPGPERSQAPRIAPEVGAASARLVFLNQLVIGCDMQVAIPVQVGRRTEMSVPEGFRGDPAHDIAAVDEPMVGQRRE
jgi:hypothetical protein